MVEGTGGVIVEGFGDVIVVQVNGFIAEGHSNSIVERFLTT